jgi:hypothetical protein
VTAQERQLARGALLAALAALPTGWSSSPLTHGIVRLAVTTEEKRQTRDILLGRVSQAPAWNAVELLVEALGLSTTAVGSRQVLEVLLGWLEDGRRTISEAAFLARHWPRLDTTAEENRRLQIAVLELLDDNATDHTYTSDLMGWLSQFPVAADLKSRTWDVLLTRLNDEQINDYDAKGIMALLVQIQPTTSRDERRGRDLLLRQIGHGITRFYTADGPGGLLLRRLSPRADDKRYVRNVLIGLLDNERRSRSSIYYMAVVGELISQFEPTLQETHHVREVMLRSTELDRIRADEVIMLGDVLSQLHGTLEDHRLIRNALLARLPSAQKASWPDYGIKPEFSETTEFVTAIRRHSAPNDWLALLSSKRLNFEYTT